MVRPKASAELAGPLGDKTGFRPAGADFPPSGLKVSPPVKHFKAPKESFENLDAEAVAALVASAGDIAIVMDDKGVIRDSRARATASCSSPSSDRSGCSSKFVEFQIT